MHVACDLHVIRPTRMLPARRRSIRKSQCEGLDGNVHHAGLMLAVAARLPSGHCNLSPAGWSRTQWRFDGVVVVRHGSRMRQEMQAAAANRPKMRSSKASSIQVGRLSEAAHRAHSLTPPPERPYRSPQARLEEEMSRPRPIGHARRVPQRPPRSDWSIR